MRVWYEMYAAEERDAKGRPCQVIRACVDLGNGMTHDSWGLVATGSSEKEIRRCARDELLNVGMKLRSVLPARDRRQMLKLGKTAELQHRGKYHFDAF